VNESKTLVELSPANRKCQPDLPEKGASSSSSRQHGATGSKVTAQLTRDAYSLAMLVVSCRNAFAIPVNEVCN
jgi:hypothetical protein